MNFLGTLEVGHDQPDQDHFGYISPLPSPMPFPPALPGSPTLPPSGAVTPAATVPPSPTLAPEVDTPPLVFHLPSSPTCLTPDETLSISLDTSASYFNVAVERNLEAASLGSRRSCSPTSYPRPRLLKSEHRLSASHQVAPGADSQLFETSFCTHHVSTASPLAPLQLQARPASLTDFQGKEASTAHSGLVDAGGHPVTPVEVASCSSNGAISAQPPQMRPHNTLPTTPCPPLSQPQQLNPCSQETEGCHCCGVDFTAAPGAQKEFSGVPRLRAEGMGHEPMPSVSSGGSNGPSKRNAMFSTDVSPLDEDFNSWIAYLSNNQKADTPDTRTRNAPPRFEPVAVTPPAKKSLLVDTGIYTRRGSGAGISDSPIATTGRRLSLSLPASSDDYIFGWRRDIAPPSAVNSPDSRCDSPTSTSSGDNRPLPPQAPPPKRPLPLLPDTTRHPLSSSVILVSDHAEITQTPLPLVPSTRKPSLAPLAPLMTCRDNWIKSGKDSQNDMRSSTLPRRERTSSTSRSRSKANATHPFAAHPFAAAGPDSSPPPLRTRAGSVNSLGSPTSVTSPSAPSFSSVSSKRTAVQVHVQGVSSCSPTQFLGNNGAPSQFQQATWAFSQRSPEAQINKLAGQQQQQQQQQQHLGVGNARLDAPHDVWTSKRRFASVTFRGDHREHSHGHDHSERGMQKKERKERRSSGYFDSKSDYGLGESRTKTFMRKIAAWAR